MSQIQQRGADRGATAVEDVQAVLELYKDPKNPDSVREIATISALFRASANAENALSWGEAMGPGVRLKFFLFCAKHKFDPTSNHVYILGGRPYVSIEGRMYKASADRDDDGKNTFEGFEVDRVLTTEERTSYEIPEGAIGWLVQVRRADCKFPFLGIGVAGGQAEKNPVARGDRLAMAQKRAREKALRLAYPLDASPDEGDLFEPKPVDFEVVPNNPATPAQPATVEPSKATTEAARAEADPLGAARERFKALNIRHPAITSAQRAEAKAGGDKITKLDLAALTDLCEAIEAEASSPELAEARGEIRALRLRHPEAFTAVLGRTVAIEPRFSPERSNTADAQAFLEDLRVEAAKGGAS
jgi:hypothetical protein